MPADQGLIDAVADANIKTLAESTSFWMAQSMGNHVQSQNRLQILAETAMAKSIELLQNISMSEATAENKIATGNDVASQMQALLAALNSGGQGVKAMGLTPPVTATGV